MKNKREIYQALVDGKVLIAGEEKAFFNARGDLCCESGHSYDWLFNTPKSWSVLQPPTPTYQEIQGMTYQGKPVYGKVES